MYFNTSWLHAPTHRKELRCVVAVNTCRQHLYTSDRVEAQWTLTTPHDCVLQPLVETAGSSTLLLGLWLHLSLGYVKTNGTFWSYCWVHNNFDTEVIKSRQNLHHSSCPVVHTWPLWLILHRRQLLSALASAEFVKLVAKDKSGWQCWASQTHFVMGLLFHRSSYKYPCRSLPLEQGERKSVGAFCRLPCVKNPTSSPLCSILNQQEDFQSELTVILMLLFATS